MEENISQKEKEKAEEEMIEQAFQELLNDYLATKHRKRVEIITKAFNFANQAHKGIKRRSGEPYIMHPIAVAKIVCNEIGLGSTSICSALLHDVVEDTDYTVEDIENIFGPKIAQIVDGLTKISGGIFGDRASAQAENFKKLLLTMSDDIRVILIKIADRLHNMRTLGSMLPNKQFKIAGETLYIYAPLANRLGLYKIKTELENLSFKYEHPEEYHEIEEKLEATAVERDKVFNEFTAPIRAQLDKMGLKYRILARVKSIYSIWNKMQTKHVPFEEIYDLLAVRIIFEPRNIEEELNDCFDIYVSISKIYKPHPARLRDWVSHPKANGYQALHVTLMGNNGQWIEVQIRSERMNDVAEQGFAAHWKYKGIKSENGLDDWMNNVREVLEAAGNGGALELMRDFKMDLYDKEVFVFTPKGDLYKLPLGATLLDFAFLIHTGLGCKCVGGKVNGKIETIKYKLKSGDTIEVLTSPNQTPKQDWLNIAATSKGRVKIKQALNEQQNKAAEYGKELLQRRFKNRKIEMEDGVMMRLIKKMGYKTVTDFYNELADEHIDVNRVIDLYLEIDKKENEEQYETRTAEEFTLQKEPDESKEDELVIGGDVKGIDYKLAKCCNPIYGDEIFGFVSTEGTIKIHRKDCPNARHIYSRYRYRVVNARWSGKMGSKYVTVLRVIGNDDIGIVTNITSIISKEKNIYMRGISIDSNDGLFQGHITVTVDDISSLNSLMKKLKTVKGVKDVQRGSIR